MVRNSFGEIILEENDLIEQLYKDPNFDFSEAMVTNYQRYNYSVKSLYADFPMITPDLESYGHGVFLNVEDYDRRNQQHWFMPNEYQELDVWEHLSTRMAQLAEKGEFGAEHLERVLEEMRMFEERDLIPLLRYLIYLVDTLREKKVLWGVGRGSSVSSYVLYLIGIHRIDSFKYNLNIREFLK